MIGRKLLHYEVVGSLGAGGMGEVYRARDTRLGRDVAVKVLPLDRSLDDTSRRRFQREAMAASALNHPNIITIYEINSEADTDFIVMEYVRGVTLSSRLKQSLLSIDEAVGYASQIADAVSKAHAASIIHRDLKPGNVMITGDGLVKVLDFGLAKFDSSATNTQGSSTENLRLDLSLSQPGAVTGTIAYMSPEQARGDRVDTRSDVFSFGIVCFEMLSGQHPFAGPNAIAILHNVHFSPPRDLYQLRPEVPPALMGLVSRMLEKPPEKRPTMAEVASMLRAGARAAGMGSVTWHSGDAAGDATQDKMSASAWGSVATVASGRASADGRRVLWGVGAVLLVAVLGVGGFFLKRRASSKGTAAETTTAPAEQDTLSLYKRGRYALDHFDRPGAIEQAVGNLERAVTLDPESAASFAALAEAYYRKNTINVDPQWIKLTAQAAQRALDLNPDLAATQIAIGLKNMQVKHVDEAEKAFRSAASLDPKSGGPDRWLGILYEESGKGDRAREALNRSQLLEPADWRTYMDLALNAFNAAKYEEAAANWRRALELEPDNRDALDSLGAVYHILGRDDDAATALQRALEIKPDSDVYNNLGTVRFYQGRFEDSVALFEKSVALNANLYDRWSNLGDAYRWSPGHADKAKEAFKQAIQLVREEIVKAPDQADLRANLAMYLAKTGDKEGALMELGPLEQRKKKSPAVLYTMAIAFEVCHQRDKALDVLESAIKAGQSMADLKSEPEFAALRADPRYHLRMLNANPPKP